MHEKFSPDINKLININQHFFFLGTMHLAESSAEIVEKTIKTLNLDCVMIELDQIRYQNLMENKEEVDEKKLSTKDFSFQSSSKPKERNTIFMESLKEIQEELGKILGITPGIEMISAINAVKTMDLPILFIDRPIMDTFQRLQEIQEEVQSEQDDLLDSLKDNSIDTNTSELQDLMKQMQKPGFLKEIIIEFKKNYPNLAKILLTERNDYMVSQIIDYSKQYPNHRILVITGAGHTQEIYEEIKIRMQRI